VTPSGADGNPNRAVSAVPEVAVIVSTGLMPAGVNVVDVDVGCFCSRPAAPGLYWCARLVARWWRRW